MIEWLREKKTNIRKCPEKQNRMEKSRTITFPFTVGTNKIHESIYLDLVIHLEDRIKSFNGLSPHHKGKKSGKD